MVLRSRDRKASYIPNITLVSIRKAHYYSSDPPAHPQHNQSYIVSPVPTTSIINNLIVARISDEIAPQFHATPIDHQALSDNGHAA